MQSMRVPNSHNNDILGLVLCGGKSTRMGRDKGMLSIGAERWFEKSFNLLSLFFSKVVISIHSDQFSKYNEVQPSIEYVQDSYKLAGSPLTGILSVNAKYPDRDIFVLACDMIKMENGIVDKLIKERNLSPSNDFYLYKTGKFLEPLCAIYSAKGLQKIANKLLKHKSESFALHKLILQYDSLVLNVDAKDEIYFSNFNSPRDL